VALLLASSLVILLAGVAAAAPKPPRDSTRVHRRVPKRPVRYEFASIPWLTPADSALFVLQGKGFHPTPGGKAKDGLTLEGRMFEHWCTVHGSLDDHGRVRRWEIVVPVGRDEHYVTMRKLYDDMDEELCGKYGTPSAVSDAFEFPFHKGDGREASALKQGLAKIRREWTSRRGDRVSIELSRELSLILGYTSKDWTELDRQRRAKNARDL
jgi:hypothetical protein